MKRILLLLSLLFLSAAALTGQNRNFTRGADPGELYLAGVWYGLYSVYGPPYYDEARSVILRFTENGKTLSMQYETDYFANGEMIKPDILIADATPGVLYNKDVRYTVDDAFHRLWVSFDYGKNWTFREENIIQTFYYGSNFEGLIYKGKERFFQSNDYGESFEEIMIPIPNYGGIKESGIKFCEFWSTLGSNLYAYELTHTMDCRQTYVYIPLDSIVAGNICGLFPDVYRGSKEEEVYVTSWFPDESFKASFSADTGHTFREVYRSEPWQCDNNLKFMTDREPGVFYVTGFFYEETEQPWGRYLRLPIHYYRGYGDTLVTTYVHCLSYDYPAHCPSVMSLTAEVRDSTDVYLSWETPTTEMPVMGYRLFRNNEPIGEELIFNTFYLDENVPKGNHTYHIKTVYQDGCESLSYNMVYVAIEKTVGIDIVVKDENISLYPNPTTGQLTIAVGAQGLAPVKIQLFDIFERLILETSESSFDVSHLPAGIYFIRIEAEQGIITKKVIKQ